MVIASTSTVIEQALYNGTFEPTRSKQRVGSNVPLSRIALLKTSKPARDLTV